MSRSVDNLGVGDLFATLNIDVTGSSYDLTASHEGMAVALSGNNETDLGSNGGTLLGKLVSVQADIAVVQVRGVCRLPYNNTAAPSVGGGLVVDGAGKVKASASGRGLVLSVDTATEQVEVLL